VKDLLKSSRNILILGGVIAFVMVISLVGCFSNCNEVRCNCEEECTLECVCGCDGVAVFAPLRDRDNAKIAVIGSNAALANVGIDMTLEYLETLGRTAEFNEIHDRDVLRALKSGRVDVAISFEPRTNDRELMWLPLISRDSERFYIAVRRSDTEFKNGFEQFVNDYHRNGDLERLARRHMANYRDFLNDIYPPFRFER